MNRWLLHHTARSLAAASMLAALACTPPLHAQGGSGTVGAAPPPDKLWAAQTSPTEVKLQWAGVPDAVTYRVFCGIGAAAPRLMGSVSGSGSGAPRRDPLPMLFYTVRVAGDAVHRCSVEALDAEGRVSTRADFNEVVPVASSAVPTTLSAPETVTATETATGEITVTWNEVPGATAYFVGRAVSPGGFRVVCQFCPVGGRYVDRDVSAGVKHTYTIAAIGPGGVSRRITSNALTPGDALAAAGEGVAPSGGETFSNPQLPMPVSDTTVLAPIVDEGAPADMQDLATPRIDSVSTCDGTGTSAPDSTRPALRRRPAAGTVRAEAEPTPEDPPAEEVPVSAAYAEGRCRNPRVAGYPALWEPVASRSGLSHEEQVAAWKEIGIVALAYKHILDREPTAEETKQHVASLQGGTQWRQLWRELAHSPEREQRFGYWAPVPLPTASEAQSAFGLAFAPTTEQCFGGIGPACAGGIPEVMNSRVQPRWFGFFKLPDGTQMGYVSIGVAVGSILHDNACLRDRGGLNCNGLGAGDLIKTGLWPAGLEWNKAAWNVIDGRTWRDVFGPYPTSTELRTREWYDDIRLVDNRPSMMAEVISMLAFPGLTVVYRGGETRRSKALEAPSGTSLDDTDPAFCAGGGFQGERQLAPFKASWAFCR